MRPLRIGTLIIAVIGLVGGSAVGGDAASFRERLAAITARQVEARRQYHQDLQGKTTEEAIKPVRDRYITAVEANAGAALALVRAEPADPAVVEALTFVVDNARAGPSDLSYQAMAIALDHARELGMGDFCGHICYFARNSVAEDLIRAVLRANPNRDDRARACFDLASLLQMRGEMIRKVRDGSRTIDHYASTVGARAEVEQLVRDGNPDSLDREAAGLLERVVAEFADVKGWSGGEPLGPIAAGELFALRHLKVGQVAPEIAGKDADGRSFSLVDLRGKVVVLTFSGNWCGPCVAMYPDERDLVAGHKDEPFALVSVNTDADLATLRQSIAEGAITWRCWWDGGTSGPITTRWGVSSFPTVFVLDPAGVIRCKDVRGEALRGAVATLLAEPRH